jgi:hypothetical protein
MTTWTYGNTTLATYGKVVVINDYLSSPARRGNNMVIPFHHGSIFVKKFYDERIMTFGIAVTAASLTALEAVFDAMRAKFAPLTEQVLKATMTDATVREANAIVNGAIQVEPITSTFAKVVVEFSLARPFFRSDTAIASTVATIDADNHDLDVDNTGTIEERDPTIILTGPLNDVVITNTTNGLVLTYTGDIPAGSHVDIYTSAYGGYVAYLDDGSPPLVNVLGNITHTGDTAFMVFNVGVNHLHIHSDVTTTGTVEVTFNAPYA